METAINTFSGNTHEAWANSFADEATDNPDLAMNEHVVPKKTEEKWGDLSLNVKLDKAGKACLLATSERMVYYVPATGCRIRPAMMSLQLKMGGLTRDGQTWTWKISTPILSGTLPTALFSCCITL